ncbi:MAG: hypothetical protein ACKPJJ_03805, partial [Planctomycetaceae bacterium]
MRPADGSWRVGAWRDGTQVVAGESWRVCLRGACRWTVSGLFYRWQFSVWLALLLLKLRLSPQRVLRR